IAPLATTLRFVDDGSPGAGAVWTWTSGTASTRRFVVSWENAALATDSRVAFQAQLFEGPGRIVFAYATVSVATGTTHPRLDFAGGLDEPGGARVVAPFGRLAGNHGFPTCDLAFEPRTVLFNSPGAPRVGEDVTWQKIRRESLVADDS